MNPSLKFILIILISLEISLKANLYANIIIIIFCFIYLLLHKIKIKFFIQLLLIPLLAAIAIFVSIYYFSPNHNFLNALVLFTRLYVFIFLGASFIKTISIEDLIKSLEQNLKLPSKFAYGVLAAYNIIPRIQKEVKQIRISGMMRGLHLSFLSPKLYFKAIMSALNLSDGLTKGMISHGYQEDEIRSTIIKIPLTKKDFFIFFSILGLFQLILFLI